MEDSSLLIGFVAAIFLVFLVDNLLHSSKNAPSLPPGPKGLPILGNLLDLPKPTEFAAHFWAKHKDLYGPISSVNILSKTVIILNDPETAFDLFERRSAEFSSRPTQEFAADFVGWGPGTGLLKYNDSLRFQRKAMARILGTKSAAAQYNDLQEAEVAHFLIHVLNNPKDLKDHIKREAGAVILKLSYGYNTEKYGRDPLLSMMNQAMANLTFSIVPGNFLVDNFPILRYVPEWFPGAGWKKTAKKWAKELKTTVETPFQFVQNQMAEGKHEPSFLSRALESTEDAPQDVFNYKWTATGLFAAGSDTTVAVIAAFYLAMGMFPDVQKKAQAEVDAVVGSERLPVASDRKNLPYVDALVKEMLRWHAIVPMGLPHSCSEDTAYKGYRIPKDSILLPNIWWFTHDPAVYPDPMEVRPERFLQEGKEQPPDPRQFVFGFGRRVCSGRLLAENALYLTIAQSLAVFNVTKAVVDGKVVELKAEFEPLAVSHPVDFQVSVKPRSSHHEELVRSMEAKFSWQESNAKDLNLVSE